MRTSHFRQAGNTANRSLSRTMGAGPPTWHSLPASQSRPGCWDTDGPSQHSGPSQRIRGRSGHNAVQQAPQGPPQGRCGCCKDGLPWLPPCGGSSARRRPAQLGRPHAAAAGRPHQRGPGRPPDAAGWPRPRGWHGWGLLRRPAAAPLCPCGPPWPHSAAGCSLWSLCGMGWQGATRQSVAVPREAGSRLVAQFSTHSRGNAFLLTRFSNADLRGHRCALALAAER